MMKIKLSAVIFGFIFLVTMLYACKETTPVTNTIQDELRQRLYELSPEGSKHFVLPNENRLSDIPSDLKNPLSPAKVKLGRLLYHESALAINPNNKVNYHTYSCASCHSAAAGFQAGMKQGIGDGGSGYGFKGEARHLNPICQQSDLDIQPIKTPTTLNSAYQEITLWNGQFGATGPNLGTESKWINGDPISNNNLGYEGVETQAIAGFKVHRMGVDVALLSAEPYKSLFAEAFPDIPEAQRYSAQTIGLAIAAYERTLLSNLAPFQSWLKGDDYALTENQIKGAMVFFGKGECGKCHSGPALNSMNFYSLGMNDLGGPGVYGDVKGGIILGRGGFTGNPNDNYKFKVPQLYNLKDVNFYGHGGSFTSIEEVVRYKNNAVPENTGVSTSSLASDFHPLFLTEVEIMQLVDFVENALYDPNLERYEPLNLPSGMCFPNNDSLSRKQRGCN